VRRRNSLSLNRSAARRSRIAFNAAAFSSRNARTAAGISEGRRRRRKPASLVRNRFSISAASAS